MSHITSEPSLLLLSSLLLCRFDCGRCEHCRSHFVEMYDACDNGRCVILPVSGVRGGQPAEGEASLMLWVWRMHNAVNARLVPEGLEEVERYR